MLLINYYIYILLGALGITRKRFGQLSRSRFANKNKTTILNVALNV